jgi:hypothetical protein
MWSFYVDEADLPCIGSLLSVALDCTTPGNDKVDLPVGILERFIGIATSRWWGRRRLLPAVAIIMSVVVMIIKAIVAVVVSVVVSSIIAVIVVVIILVSLRR